MKTKKKETNEDRMKRLCHKTTRSNNDRRSDDDRYKEHFGNRNPINQTTRRDTTMPTKKHPTNGSLQHFTRRRRRMMRIDPSLI